MDKYTVENYGQILDMRHLSSHKKLNSEDLTQVDRESQLTMIEKFSKSDAHGNNLRNVDMMTINTEKSGRKIRLSARSQDYDYDDSDYESDQEEDKVVKISVLFKNEEMERKIEDLGWSAKDLNSLEKDIESRKKDLESNEKELSQKESEFTRRIEQLSKKHTDLTSKITENDAHQKDLIATHRAITKKNSDIDRVITSLNQKMTNLNQEEISIRERSKFLKAEITKTKEKTLQVQKKKKELSQLDLILDNKYLEIKTIESNFSKKNQSLETEYNARLQKSSTQISALVARANRLDMDIKINNKLLSDKKDEISNLECCLDTLEQQLTSTERYADRKEKEITKKSADNAKLQ
jgi:chromosome segregation ATPase